MASARIPDVVIRRIVTYLRVLRDYSAGGKGYISSWELGDLAAVNSAQVRKDLALFGEFGKQGVGYPVQGLTTELVRILGADREMPVAIFGVGELGTALVKYLAGRKQSNPAYPFYPAALFDTDVRKIGTVIEGLTVRAPSSLAEVLEETDVKVGLLTVPASAAQDVADYVSGFGIKGFLNFAPAKLRLPPGVRLINADVTLQLEELAYYI